MLDYSIDVISNVKYSIEILDSTFEKNKIKDNNPKYIVYGELYGNNVYLKINATIKYKDAKYKIEFLQPYDVT